ncbi:MAG: tRNA (N(6)-L-threonylcarbamoyladenosine(37)-C(2))-methylthiotransferase MtaB [Alphaproteobacteria bacterium]|nr:tRNA (N(6)-L-threonylcarbamoyladenosine(37)-C(2))-methylthiotransferase MtaB [Alphaproteobacteria bacterium]
MKIVTFGCRINTYESALINQIAGDLDDIIVVNTCAVTAEAERQCRQTIRKLRKENPTAKLIVTGCAAQLHPEIYADMPEVDRVIGNREKITREALMADDKVLVGDVSNADFDIPIVTDFEGRTRAFIQVQQGCDHACTFCVVRQVRGRNKGILPEQVIKQAQTFVGNGYSELVLTGIDVTSYPYGFSDLVEKVLKEVPGLKRLRFGSMDPAGVDDKLIDLFGKYDVLMPHMHLSVQSGDNLILRRMGRRHKRETVIELAQKLRAVRPGFVLGSDFITGFPTETKEMFQNTLDLVRQTEIILLHVFPFSVRPGTPSAKMEMVDVHERRERAHQLRELGNELLQKYLNTQIGKTAKVLVEKDGQGFNEHYIPTKLNGSYQSGQILSVINEGVSDNGFVAKV